MRYCDKGFGAQRMLITDIFSYLEGHWKSFKFAKTFHMSGAQKGKEKRLTTC